MKNNKHYSEIEGFNKCENCTHPKKFILVSDTNGRLIKDDMKYVTEMGVHFDYEQDLENAVVKFDTKEEAEKFIEENNFYALQIVEEK